MSDPSADARTSYFEPARHSPCPYSWLGFPPGLAPGDAGWEVQSPVNGQIVAIGGGTFLAEDHDPRIDAFILSLTGRPRPRVCYLGTAGVDHEHGMCAFYRAMSATTAVRPS